MEDVAIAALVAKEKPIPSLQQLIHSKLVAISYDNRRDELIDLLKIPPNLSFELRGEALKSLTAGSVSLKVLLLLYKDDLENLILCEKKTVDGNEGFIPDSEPMSPTTAGRKRLVDEIIPRKDEVERCRNFFLSPHLKRLPCDSSPKCHANFLNSTLIPYFSSIFKSDSAFVKALFKTDLVAQEIAKRQEELETKMESREAVRIQRYRKEFSDSFTKKVIEAAPQLDVSKGTLETLLKYTTLEDHADAVKRPAKFIVPPQIRFDCFRTTKSERTRRSRCRC